MYKKIVVNPTNIVINNYNFGDAPQIESLFSIYNKVTHIISYDHISYNKGKKQLILPRGIDIPYLENVFGVRAFINQSCDKYRENNEQILLRYGPKDDKQREAINFLLGQDKYSYTKNYSQLMLALGTGSGKTYLGIAYSAFMNLKSIVITTSSHWLTQWKERIIRHTNIISKEVYHIQGSATINSLMNKKSEDIDNKYKIYLITHSTLLSYANNNGWDKIRELFTHLGIGVKIFDEAHLNFENITNIDYNTSTYKTLYLTATPGRGDEKEDSIFKLYFKNIPRIILFDPESDPHTNYIAIRYKSGLNASEISNCVSNYGFNNKKYCDMVIYKENFDYICRIVFDILSHISGKIIIFLATNNAIVYMYEWIKSNYPEYGNSVGIFTSINTNKESALTCKIILSTAKSACEALDISDLTCSVQLAEPIKSEYRNRQRLGRTRGFNTFYIDIVDESCAIAKKYYISNLPMFETHALSTKEMRLSNKELENRALSIIKRRKEHGISPFIKL